MVQKVETTDWTMASVIEEHYQRFPDKFFQCAKTVVERAQLWPTLQGSQSNEGTAREEESKSSPLFTDLRLKEDLKDSRDSSCWKKGKHEEMQQRATALASHNGGAEERGRAITDQTEMKETCKNSS